MEEIKSLNIKYTDFLEWVDYPLRNRESFQFPTKTKMPLDGSDYCNIMPCAMKQNNILGVKIVNRNMKRRNEGSVNMDSQILLYDYDLCSLKALLDGSYITGVRTAAVAVHTILNMVRYYDVVSLIGLGNVMNAIGEMWFPLIQKDVTIKVMRYKKQAEAFKERFSKYSNISFEICDSHEELMDASDLIISAVSYTEQDFCAPEFFKKGCTIIPVHLRGFMGCDKIFENVVVSDLVRVKEFSSYNEMKKVTLTDDVLNGKSLIRNNDLDRVIIYNLGLASIDLYFAEKIYSLIDSYKQDDVLNLGSESKFYI